MKCKHLFSSITYILETIRLQDSLELVLDQEPVPELVEGKEPIPEIVQPPAPVLYEFHENHGRNIELINNKTGARRVASYNQGITIVQKPLEPNSKVYYQRNIVKKCF